MFPVYAQSSSWDSCMLDVGGNKIPTLSCIELVIARLVKFSSGLIIFILFIMFLIGAYYYLTAFGNDEKVKKAQNTLKFAVIGVIVFMSAYLILRIIGQVFLDDPNALLKFNLGETNP